MNLTFSLIRQLEDSTLDRNERAQICCRLAKEFEEAGNYEAAREAMGELWRRVGESPTTSNLNEMTAGEVLLRAGVLSGWLSAAQQREDAQQLAKDLVSRSLALFERLRRPEKVAEAQMEMAVCYWREGDYTQARAVLREASGRIGERDNELKVRMLLRGAVVEKDANRQHEALDILIKAATLFEASPNHSLKGKFHGELGNLLEMIGAAEEREDYRDRALLEYAAASFHFERAGHMRYSARVENDLGLLLLAARRFPEAQEHLDRARRLFQRLKDERSVAQVDETRARVFLAEGGNEEAEKAARASVRVLERASADALLAEALITQGAALARLGQHERARSLLERAGKVAQQSGVDNSAGRAALTLIEELGGRLSVEELRQLYERADRFLAHSRHAGTLQRLRHAARCALSAQRPPMAFNDELGAPPFIYASEESAKLLRDAHRMSETSHPVLITGETGTGKSLLARLIHQWSGRSGRFIEINCSTLSKTEAEAELFGCRKGSLGGAAEERAGAVREAAGGTLLLDEIGELGMKEQMKLLRLIEYGEVHSLGAARPELVDVRILATNNSQLEGKVAQRLFREDLFYRLQSFQLEIAPLRERPEDIAMLAEHFIKQSLARHGERVSFSAGAIAAMKQLPLKGNARELGSLIERTVLVAPQSAEVKRDAVEMMAMRQTPSDNFADAWAGCQLDEEVRLFEGKLIRQALEAANGQITRAARLLGVTHQCLAYILQGRQKELLASRTPVQKRRRSIIQVPQVKKVKKRKS